MLAALVLAALSLQPGPPELAAFRASRDGYALVIAGASGERRRVIRWPERRRLRPALFQPASWSSRGGRLALTVEAGRTPATGRTDVWVMRADGTRRRRLTHDGRSFHPVWSPGAGGRIWFARRHGRRFDAPVSIWSMRPDGSDERQVTTGEPGVSTVPGSFSPDGALLAFTRSTYRELDEEGRAHNTAEVWVMSVDGSGVRRLAERAREPAWSPDGRTIVFASDRDENGSLSYGDRVFYANELYAMDPDGSDPRRLTRTRASNERLPSWAPGADRIAWQRGRDYQNAEAMVVMQGNADGTCARLVFADPGRDAWPWHAAPTWRPGRGVVNRTDCARRRP